MDRNILLADLRTRVRHGIVDDRIQIHGFGVEGVQVGCQRGDLDHVIGQTADALRGNFDAVHEFSLQPH